MNLHTHRLEFHFTFPNQNTPEWHSKVDRWYQLDAYGYGLTEATWIWRKEARLQLPDAILLASPGASNESDYQFASTGADSAQKFAHTLPNVRISPVAQALDWSGLVLCLQKDPHTLSTAIEEAATLLSGEKPIWILSVFKQNEKNDKYTVTAIEIFTKRYGLTFGCVGASPKE